MENRLHYTIDNTMFKYGHYDYETVIDWVCMTYILKVNDTFSDSFVFFGLNVSYLVSYYYFMFNS